MPCPTRSLRDFLRDRGYKYQAEDRRHEIYRHPQTKHRAVLPKRDALEDETATNILRQAGETPETVRKFLGSAHQGSDGQKASHKS